MSELWNLESLVYSTLNPSSSTGRPLPSTVQSNEAHMNSHPPTASCVRAIELTHLARKKLLLPAMVSLVQPVASPFGTPGEVQSVLAKLAMPTQRPAVHPTKVTAPGHGAAACTDLESEVPKAPKAMKRIKNARIGA